jgi:hypothetical protein
LVPEVQNLTAKLSAWCTASSSSSDGEDDSHDGDVPVWHADARASVLKFAERGELEAAFDMAVAAIDDLTSVVAKAGDWLQCLLGATRWEGIPEPFGYVMPLSWANEMLGLPEFNADGYKEQVQNTQVAAATAKLR